MTDAVSPVAGSAARPRGRGLTTEVAGPADLNSDGAAGYKPSVRRVRRDP